VYGDGYGEWAELNAGPTIIRTASRQDIETSWAMLPKPAREFSAVKATCLLFVSSCRKSMQQADMHVKQKHEVAAFKHMQNVNTWHEWLIELRVVC
jgi:hypothetical protein